MSQQMDGNWDSASLLNMKNLFSFIINSEQTISLI